MSRFRPDLSDEPAVRLDGVSLTYERTGEVLSEIDLVLKQGSFTFLTGPSGAGKSSPGCAQVSRIYVELSLSADKISDDVCR